MLSIQVSLPYFSCCVWAHCFGCNVYLSTLGFLILLHIWWFYSGAQFVSVGFHATIIWAHCAFSWLFLNFTVCGANLPLELKERVLQDLPTSSVVQFACTLSTEWHWTFLGGCHMHPKGFVDTYLRPIFLGSILAMIQRYSMAISYIGS